MTKLIDKIMPYKVVAEDTILQVNEDYDIQMKGFTKRFAREEGLEKYMKRKLKKQIFSYNFVKEDKTYHVYPGKLAIAKANAGF